MNTIKSLRLPLIFATIFLVLGLVDRVQAQATGSTTLLDEAYATLAQGDHDYKGHRVRAMKQIEAALTELGSKISGHGKGHESQGTSDAQLRAAQTLLQQASTSVTGKTLKHVNAAIEQINLALAIK